MANRSYYNKWELERHPETGEYYLQIFCGLSNPMMSKMFATKAEALVERMRLNNALRKKDTNGKREIKKRESGHIGRS